jgi:hypothetical protein
VSHDIPGSPSLPPGFEIPPYLGPAAHTWTFACSGGHPIGAPCPLPVTSGSPVHVIDTSVPNAATGIAADNEALRRQLHESSRHLDEANTALIEVADQLSEAHAEATAARQERDVYQRVAAIACEERDKAQAEADRLRPLEAEAQQAHATATRFRDERDAAREQFRAIELNNGQPVVFSAAVAPGGWVCAVTADGNPDGICGTPVESEPCPDHARQHADVRPRDGERGFFDVTCGSCGEEFGTNFKVEEIACPECEARRCPQCRTWFGGDR